MKIAIYFSEKLILFLFRLHNTEQKWDQFKTSFWMIFITPAMVGAGTVTSEADLEAVTLAGAVFAISPGLTPELLKAANRGKIALIPGIATMSELMTGIQLGYDHFKFFPAQVAGGVQALKAIAGPFPRITFCPTDGITLENYRDYLALKNVACVGGSWLCTTSAVEHQDWESITRAARTAVDFNAVDHCPFFLR